MLEECRIRANCSVSGWSDSEPERLLMASRSVMSFRLAVPGWHRICLDVDDHRT
jgi:hypothetical protein